jgi:WD40 repeat protein
VAKKAWSAYIETTSSSPYIAIGTDENVVIHSFTDGSLSTEPYASLGGPGSPTPVYCAGAFIPGGNPNIIASGWYDGKVRVHDLRSSQRTRLSETSAPLSKKTALASVMTFSDPWRSFDPVYSLAARGGMEDENERSSGGGLPHQYHYLTAGSALHSVVCLWDVRKPSQSWSVYAPGGDRSPVYALKAEGSRVWGATQWRAFVLDFAPDAPRTSFPLVHDSVTVNGPPTYVHFPRSS